jgi:2,3,4,5-tetrahydropyridine-2-carboxylate N-succinyltransferase
VDQLGPCAVDGFEQTRVRLRARGHVTVTSIDKFPRMVDYVSPSGPHRRRRPRASRRPPRRRNHRHARGLRELQRRHPRHVDGRGSHLGRCDRRRLGHRRRRVHHGYPVGRWQEIITIGKRCLLGANAGCGILLGDDCVVEAGLYITAGTKVTGPDGSVVKARDLAGRSNLLFRRNSVTGAVEVTAKEGDGIELNEALHAHN